MKRRATLIAFSIVAVLCTLASAAEGLRIGDEFPLLSDGPGRNLQATPAVAYGSGVYLVAWREGWHGKNGSARICAARVSPEGKILDPRGIQVAPATAGVQERPRLAFGGGVFLVVWQDLRSGRDYDVLAARISPEGKPLDAAPIPIAAGPRNQVLPDVASDGSNFLVVYQGLQDDRTAYRGFAVTVSAQGKVGAPIETGMTPQPKVAWNGAHYLIASGGGGGVFAGTVNVLRCAADGQPLGKPTPVVGGTKTADFSLTGVPASKSWLVVSHRSLPDPWGWGGPGAIRAALVNADGKLENPEALKEPAGIKQRLPHWLDMGSEKKAGATWPWGPSASAFDGKRTIVVWQRHHLAGEKWTNFENCDLIAARVDGVRSLDPAGIPVAASPANERAPAVAGDGNHRLLVVYEKDDPAAPADNAPDGVASGGGSGKKVFARILNSD